jgi:hypothetical protein
LHETKHLAFLNASNLTGFSADEIAPIEVETIVDLLLNVSQYDGVPERKFKQLAKRLKKTSRGAIPHSRALEIVSRAFGYAHWYEASRLGERNGNVCRNQRDWSTLNLRTLLGLNVTVVM